MVWRDGMDGERGGRGGGSSAKLPKGFGKAGEPLTWEMLAQVMLFASRHDKHFEHVWQRPMLGAPEVPGGHQGQRGRAPGGGHLDVSRPLSTYAPDLANIETDPDFTESDQRNTHSLEPNVLFTHATTSTLMCPRCTKPKLGMEKAGPVDPYVICVVYSNNKIIYTKSPVPRCYPASPPGAPPERVSLGVEDEIVQAHEVRGREGEVKVLERLGEPETLFCVGARIN